MPADTEQVPQAAQRIDKWLWYARFLKTRTLATKYVTTGKVRVNKTRISKPGHTVTAGDIITFTLHQQLRVVEVVAPGTRRGPAEEARSLYNDLSPKPPGADSKAAPDAGRSPAARPAGSGRPTKKERRERDAWVEGKD